MTSSSVFVFLIVCSVSAFAFASNDQVLYNSANLLNLAKVRDACVKQLRTLVNSPYRYFPQTEPRTAFSVWASAHAKPYLSSQGPCEGSQECSKRYATFLDNIAFIHAEQQIQPEIQVCLT